MLSTLRASGSSIDVSNLAEQHSPKPYRFEMTIVTLYPHNLAAPNSVLRSKSLPVNEVNAEVLSIIQALRQALASVPYGTGLAAIQIGIPYQIAVINLPSADKKELVIINPRLISATGRLISRQEGCLSLPDHKGPVRRRNKIVVEYIDIHGELSIYQGIGYDAAIIQHEIDHMHGILYWDRIEVGSPRRL